MATKTATFAVNLKDGTSSSANAAAASLKRLQSKIDADTKALTSMKRAMRQLQGGTSVNVKAFRALQERLDKTKNSISKNRAKYIELGGAFGKVAPKARRVAKSTEGLGKALTGANGPLGSVASGFSKLGKLLTNPITLVVVLAAAFVALAASIAVAAAALLKFGVVSSDARRAEALHIEGLNSLQTMYGRASASVGDFQAALDRASDSTNVGRSTLLKYARSLSRIGLRGAALTDSVEAMGIAFQVQGERGARRFRALATATRLSGGSVADLAAAYKRTLGPIARRQLLSIENQTNSLRGSLERIFSGLRIEGFLSALDQTLSLFSQSTATGKALKAIVEALFQPAIDDVSTLGPIVRRFFQGATIGALLLTIAFLKVRNAILDMLPDNAFGDLDALDMALDAGVFVVGVLAGAVAGLTLLFGALALAVFTAAAPLLIIIAAVAAIGIGIGFLAAAIEDFLSSFDFGAFATDLIDGLVNGLRSGARRVMSAVRGLADGAKRVFRSALGIASPSKVFAELGMNVAQGLSGGIDSGAGQVNESVSDLVDVPTVSDLVDVPTGGGVQGGATSISIGDITIQAGDASTARELALTFRDELAAALSGVNIELGVAT